MFNFTELNLDLEKLLPWLIFLGILLILKFTLFRAKFMKVKPNTVRAPNYRFNFSAYMMVIGLFLSIFIWFYPYEIAKLDKIVYFFIFVVLTIGGVILTIFYFNFKLVIDEEKVIFRNEFGRKKKYKIEEISYEERDNKIDIYYLDKRLITFEEHSINTDVIKEKIKPNTYDFNSIGTIKATQVLKTVWILLLVAGIIVTAFYIYISIIGSEFVSCLFFLIVGITFLLFSLYFFLFKKFFKIAITLEEVYITDIFNKTKTYKKDSLIYKKTPLGFIIYLKDENKKVIYYNSSFVDKPNLISALSEKITTF